MGKLLTLIKRFNMYLYGSSAALVIFVVIITSIDVVGRYFRMPVPGAFELSHLALSCMIFMTLAHTQAQKGHISLDLSIPLPPKVNSIIDIFLTLFSLFLMALITWKSVPFVLDAYRSNEWSDYHHLPIFLFKIFMFVGGLTFCLQLIIDIIAICNKSRGDTCGNNVT